MPMGATVREIPDMVVAERAERAELAELQDIALPQPILLVIFDCDGVLIDSEIISARVLIDEAARDGVALTFDHVRDHFLGRSFPTVAATIREQFATALPPDFESRYRDSLLARFESELVLTPGVLDVITRLAVPYCLATSSSPPRLEHSLRIAGVDNLFAHCFTASQVRHGKPAPDLFLHVAAEMGVPPAACLVIEDSRPGVAAALAAGMQVGLYAGGSHMQGWTGQMDGPKVTTFTDWAQFGDLWPQVVTGGRA